MRGTLYLVQKGRTWWFKRAAPKDLWGVLGRTAFMRSLETSDRRVAEQRRGAAFAECEATFAAARARLTSGPDPVLDEALAWQEERRSWEADRFAWAARTFHGNASDENADAFTHLLTDTAERIGREHGEEEEGRFLRIAAGAVPVDFHIDAHLREAAISPRTAQERRTAVRRLKEWRPLADLSRFDRRLAGRYVSERLAEGHPKTANKAISNLSAYWRWLVERGHVLDNPWTGQSVKRPRSRAQAPSKRERPFTDDEIARLLTAPAPARMQGMARLRDAMRIAALSGMRIEEICRLTVADCAGEMFNVRASKTEAGVRKVPIHPELREIIERRRADKAPAAYLFHDLEKRGGGERSMPLSKQFTRFRRAIGVDDAEEGRRRSLVNFHSFRRWFITKAEQAGQPESTIQAVVGHRRQGVTFGTYSAGPLQDQMRACVEAVRLPPGR
jgi:integrase